MSGPVGSTSEQALPECYHEKYGLWLQSRNTVLRYAVGATVEKYGWEIQLRFTFKKYSWWEGLTCMPPTSTPPMWIINILPSPVLRCAVPSPPRRGEVFVCTMRGSWHVLVLVSGWRTLFHWHLFSAHLAENFILAALAIPIQGSGLRASPRVE